MLGFLAKRFVLFFIPCAVVDIGIIEYARENFANEPIVSIPDPSLIGIVLVVVFMIVHDVV